MGLVSVFVPEKPCEVKNPKGYKIYYSVVSRWEIRPDKKHPRSGEGFLSGKSGINSLIP
jgi:hypothetical protein